MRNFLLVLAIFFLFISCNEEGCDDTVIGEINITFQAWISVSDRDGNDIDNYPVRYIIQKTFCDGDVGFPIEDSGNTNSNGLFVNGRIWTLPYINELDYVTVYFYAGTGANELGSAKKYYYDDIKNKSGVLCQHYFTIN